MMSKRVRLILVISFFALMLVYCLAGLYQDLANPGSSDGWRGIKSNGEYIVTEADPKGPAKELRPDDRILAINGVSVHSEPGVLGFSNRVPPGTPYTITVRRAGQDLAFTFYT